MQLPVEWVLLILRMRMKAFLPILWVILLSSPKQRAMHLIEVNPGSLPLAPAPSLSARSGAYSSEAPYLPRRRSGRIVTSIFLISRRVKGPGLAANWKILRIRQKTKSLGTAG